MNPFKTVRLLSHTNIQRHTVAAINSCPWACLNNISPPIICYEFLSFSHIPHLVFSFHPPPAPLDEIIILFFSFSYTFLLLISRLFFFFLLLQQLSFPINFLCLNSFSSSPVWVIVSPPSSALSPPSSLHLSGFLSDAQIFTSPCSLWLSFYLRLLLTSCLFSSSSI